jgi:hypothetical protein
VRAVSGASPAEITSEVERQADHYGVPVQVIAAVLARK